MKLQSENSNPAILGRARNVSIVKNRFATENQKVQALNSEHMK